MYGHAGGGDALAAFEARGNVEIQGGQLREQVLRATA